MEEMTEERYKKYVTEHIVKNVLYILHSSGQSEEEREKHLTEYLCTLLSEVYHSGLLSRTVTEKKE